MFLQTLADVHTFALLFNANIITWHPYIIHGTKLIMLKKEKKMYETVES